MHRFYEVSVNLSIFFVKIFDKSVHSNQFKNEVCLYKIDKLICMCCHGITIRIYNRVT